MKHFSCKGEIVLLQNGKLLHCGMNSAQCSSVTVHSYSRTSDFGHPGLQAAVDTMADPLNNNSF